MSKSMEEKIKDAPSVAAMQGMGYCMTKTVSVHVLYKNTTRPIWLSWDWNEDQGLYENNPTRNKVTGTKTRTEMATYLESLIHDPEVASFNVEWGRWGYQLLYISGWYE